MSYGEPVRWQRERPRLRPLRLMIGWIVSAAAVGAAAVHGLLRGWRAELQAPAVTALA